MLRPSSMRDGDNDGDGGDNADSDGGDSKDEETASGTTSVATIGIDSGPRSGAAIAAATIGKGTVLRPP